MSDEFALQSQSALTPSENPYAVVPNDAADLPSVPKALYVGNGGTIVLRGKDSDVDVTFVAVPSGTQLQVRAKRIMATGTTASNIVALA